MYTIDPSIHESKNNKNLQGLVQLNLSRLSQYDTYYGCQIM